MPKATRKSKVNRANSRKKTTPESQRAPGPPHSPEKFTPAETEYHRLLLSQRTSDTERKAPPKPINHLRGAGGWIPSKPKATQAPTSFPPFYPNNLEAETWVILSKAVQRFSVQAQIPDLCRHIVSELTPHFFAEVQGKRLRADLALSSLSALLRYLAVVNCDDDSERFRLEQELRKSDEWRKFAGAVADAQISPDPIRPESLGPDEASASEPKAAIQAASTVDQRDGNQDTKPKHGPRPNMDHHVSVAAVVRRYGPNWRDESNLGLIVEELDRNKTLPPKAWARRSPPARSWRRGLQLYQELVIKALEYSLKMAARVPEN